MRALAEAFEEGATSRPVFPRSRLEQIAILLFGR